MADQSITIKFKSTGDKALKRAIENLTDAEKELRGEIVKVRKQGGMLDTSFKRNQKGATSLGNAFSTMRSKLLLVNFAMGMGINQLIKFAAESSKLKEMETAFNTLSGGVISGAVAIERLQEATNGTMSEFDLFQQANNAMILGVSKNSDEMAEMFDMAQRLGQALGKDTKLSVESLITGIGRQSRLMLDNIGIIVKADDAYRKYASKLKITVDQLTDTDRKQAFLNATLEAARQKVSNLNEEVPTAAHSFARFSANVDNLQAKLGEKLAPLLSKVADLLSDLTEDKEPLIFDKTAAFRAERNATAMEMVSKSVGTLWNIINTSPIRDQLMEDRKAFEDMVAAFELGSPQIGIAVKELERVAELGIAIAFPFQEGGDAVGEFSQKLADQISLLKIQSDFFGDEAGFREAEIAMMKEKLTLTRSGQDKDKLKLEIALKQKKLDKSIFEQRISATKQIAAATVKMGQAIADAAGDDKQQALMGLRIAYAGVLADSAAGLAKAFRQGGLKGAAAGFTIFAGLVSQLGAINEQIRTVEKMETGGLVGGRRHSQGGTIIEAEQGEFVMSRSAVDAVGIENMNRINQGGGGAVTVNVSGNVMTQDFVEGELAEAIRDATRRGTDFGVS